MTQVMSALGTRTQAWRTVFLAPGALGGFVKQRTIDVRHPPLQQGDHTRLMEQGEVTADEFRHGSESRGNSGVGLEFNRQPGSPAHSKR